VNKILKEDHKKGPLTPVDQKWISQEKFNEILKKIKTIWDFYINIERIVFYLW